MVQSMQHVKSKAVEQTLEAEAKADMYAAECARLQQEVKQRMLENCRLIAGEPMEGTHLESSTVISEKNTEDATVETLMESVSRSEEDKSMLKCMIFEMKRAKMVSPTEAKLLDKEMSNLDESSKLWAVLSRYEDQGDLRAATKDCRATLFAASGLA